jgi:hypothetical protein
MEQEKKKPLTDVGKQMSTLQERLRGAKLLKEL